MRFMFRSVLAVLAGVFAAGATVALFETVGHLIWPPPAEFLTGDLEKMRGAIHKVPIGSVLSVLLAWTVGTAVGSALTMRLAPRARLPHAVLVGGIMLGAGAANLYLLPHPVWFAVLGVAAFPLGTWLGIRLAPSSPGPEAAAAR